jgi:hypothetical protein
MKAVSKLNFGRVPLILAVILLIPSQAAAAGTASIEGYVTDKDSGKPFAGVQIETYNVSDHSKPVASSITDERGYYSMNVSPGNYDIYVRTGKTNPWQSVYLQAGQLQSIDFRISMTSISDEQMTSSPLFWAQIILAGLILLIIVIDQLFFKRKRILSDLAAERTKLEVELKKGDEIGQDEIGMLKKDKSQLEYMINLTRTKYHQRSINEESFREIIRDYQEKLIEVEAKIAALESDRKQGAGEPPKTAPAQGESPEGKEEVSDKKAGEVK